jgi:hypothetical protein
LQIPSCLSGAASSSASAIGPDPRQSISFTPLDVPSRLAPAAIILSAVAQSRTPPDALTPRASPTTRRINATASAVAPPAGWNPVEVLTKLAPASLAIAAAFTTVSGCSAAVSRMTHMAEDPHTIGAAMELFLVSRNLERVADLATNVAEDVVFLVEGKTIKHHAEKLAKA